MINSTTAPKPDAPTGRKNSGRRQYLPSSDVIAATTRLYHEGYDFQSVTEALHMSPGALKSALYRADQAELFRALKDRKRWSCEPAVNVAIRMLPLLQPEDLRDVEQRCRELLAEVADDRHHVEVQPAGRMVRGRGGIVRWVA